jgi:hypothetical protein
LKNLLVIAAAVVCLAMGRPNLQAQTTSSESGVDGKWHFVLQTPGGEREVDADFTVDKDGNVTGKWGNADASGTYKDGKLSLNFQFTSDEAGVTDAMEMDGKLDETAALGGDWAFSEYNGTFKATRPGATSSAEPAATSSDAAPAPSSTPPPSKPDPQ